MSGAVCLIFILFEDVKQYSNERNEKKLGDKSWKNIGINHNYILTLQLIDPKFETFRYKPKCKCAHLRQVCMHVHAKSICFTLYGEREGLLLAFPVGICRSNPHRYDGVHVYGFRRLVACHLEATALLRTQLRGLDLLVFICLHILWRRDCGLIMKLFKFQLLKLKKAFQV